MPTVGINGYADYYGGYCEGGGRTAAVPGYGKNRPRGMKRSGST
jgi:hypothetical protein